MESETISVMGNLRILAETFDHGTPERAQAVALMGNMVAEPVVVPPPPPAPEGEARRDDGRKR